MQTAGETKSRSLRSEWGDFLAGRTPHAFLILVLALTVAFTLRGLRRDSPTEDEWAHLVRGISYWQNSDMRIHVQHPPLANAVDGLPTVLDQNADLTQMKTWQEGYSPGLEYIKLDYGHAREQLGRGRLMAILFFLGLIVYVFYFCLSVFGWPTAAVAACLVAFNPTLIGQARYVATDLPVAAFTAIATGELVRYLMNSRRILTFGLACGGLVLSKHSGVVVLAMLTLVALGVAVLGKGIFQGRTSLSRRLLRWLGHFAIAGAITLFAINAVYKFDRTGMTVEQILKAPEPQHWVTKKYKDQMLEQRSPLPSLPPGLRIPLPYPYLFGLFAVQEQDRGGYPTYFMGQFSREGHWAYFPVLLVVKDPPALLLLLGVGALVWLRSRRRRAPPSNAEPSEAEPAPGPALATGGQVDSAPTRPPFLAGLSLPTACFLAVSVLFLVFIMRSHLNMGIRHGIPIMPLLSVLGARAFARAHELLSGNLLLAVQVLAFSGVVSTLLAGPAYLNYYNFLALGRGGYINVVGDDWGQDRENFVRFAKAKRLEPLYYHTQTTTRKLEVDYLGLQYKDFDCRKKPPTGAWVAIHSQYVHRFEDDKRCNDWIRQLQPTYRFNENIWVFRMP